MLKQAGRAPGVFTVADTNAVKGIAVLAMVLHHANALYYNHFDVSWYAANSTGAISFATLLFSTAGKVCVTVLSLLSGYGLSQSYLKYRRTHLKRSDNLRFVLSHIIQFYSVYWIMFLIKFAARIHSVSDLAGVYGVSSGKTGLLALGLDFFGVSRLFGFGCLCDWFVSAVLVMYALFPLLWFLTEKISYGVLPLTALPWVWELLFAKRGVNTDRALFYLLAFVTGILLAQKNILNRAKGRSGVKAAVISSVCVAAGFALRLIFALPADYIFGLTIVFFEIFAVSRLSRFSSVLSFFGKHSANIWLSHTVILGFLHTSVYVRFPVAFAGALLLSVLIENLKKATRFDRLVKKVRKRVEQ